MKKAVFLDLGGTIIYDKGLEKKFKEVVFDNFVYVAKPEYVVFLPRALEAIRTLSKTDYKIIIITNQSGISRGYHTEKDFFDIMEKVAKNVENKSGRIDAFYYCPHKPEDNCECRKPKTGMLKRASKEHDIELKRSWIVGDKKTDVILGKEVGCKTVLVKTGSAGEDITSDVRADYKFNNLFEAAKFIKKGR